MKLYIVRHGETVWNRHHKVQGVADIPLAENGILLAEKTGEALKNVSFDLCITSPLVRARKTAELILAKQAHKVPVKNFFICGSRYSRASFMHTTPSNTPKLISRILISRLLKMESFLQRRQGKH